GEHLADLVIQVDTGLQIMTERLLDDHAPPVSFLLLDEPGAAQLVDYEGEKRRAGGEIKQIIPLGVVTRRYLRDLGAQTLIGGAVIKAPLHVIKLLREGFPGVSLHRRLA